jgi:hypothetical protein
MGVFCSGGFTHLFDDIGERTGKREPLGTAVELVAERWLASLVARELSVA